MNKKHKKAIDKYVLKYLKKNILYLEDDLLTDSDIKYYKIIVKDFYFHVAIKKNT